MLIPNPGWVPPPPSTLREGGAERFKGVSKQRGLAGTQLWSPLAGSVRCNLPLLPGRGSAGHGLLPLQVWGGIGTIWAYRTPHPQPAGLLWELLWELLCGVWALIHRDRLYRGVLYMVGTRPPWGLFHWAYSLTH